MDLNCYTVDSSIGAKCCPLNYGCALELARRNETFHKRKCHREAGIIRKKSSEKCEEDRGNTKLPAVIISLVRLLAMNASKQAERTGLG